MFCVIQSISEGNIKIRIWVYIFSYEFAFSRVQNYSTSGADTRLTLPHSLPPYFALPYIITFFVVPFKNIFSITIFFSSSDNQFAHRTVESAGLVALLIATVVSLFGSCHFWTSPILYSYLGKSPFHLVNNCLLITYIEFFERFRALSALSYQALRAIVERPQEPSVRPQVPSLTGLKCHNCPALSAIVDRPQVPSLSGLKRQR